MDSKLLDLPSVTNLNGTESLYVVQNGEDKRVTANVFYSNQRDVVVSGKSSLGEKQILNSAGVVSANVVLTTLTAGTESNAITIEDSPVNYSEKIIICVSTGGGVYTLSGANVPAIVEFSKVGHSVTLRWVDTKWHPVGGTATITYP